MSGWCGSGGSATAAGAASVIAAAATPLTNAPITANLAIALLLSFPQWWDTGTIAHTVTGQYFSDPLSTGICAPDSVPEPSPASHTTTSAMSSGDMNPLLRTGIGG